MNAGYTSCGKEVLIDGQHFADTISPTAAAVIVSALKLFHKRREKGVDG